ncbi:MAG: glutamate racemase [Anaerolineae bacterium]|nr:glutamate racemase [Anaerolineales bacterium]MCQ3976768.1 glutamate racemase [Anaerolineae bacterium]
MTDSRPIGLFDSGVGGLSVWREVAQRMPYEATLYFADSAHCPYGPRPAAEIQALSAAITRFLLAHQAKLIVVACNTASAAALETLRAEFDVPIVGMEPAVKPAAEATRTGHVGVLATEGTLNGYLFKNTSQRHARDIEVHVQVGEGLVELVEKGQLDAPETESLLRHYLEPMLAANADQLALGCTHYPLLLPLIERVVAGRATVIDPAQAVARQVQRVLMQRGLEAETGCVTQHCFFTTGQPEPLQTLTAIFSQQQAKISQVSLNW